MQPIGNQWQLFKRCVSELQGWAWAEETADRPGPPIFRLGLACPERHGPEFFKNFFLKDYKFLKIFLTFKHKIQNRIVLIQLAFVLSSHPGTFVFLSPKIGAKNQWNSKIQSQFDSPFINETKNGSLLFKQLCTFL